MFEEREARWRTWMSAAQEGDPVAYESLLRELVPHLRSYVQRRLRDPAAFEDVVQNILLSLHKARHTWRSERPFGPWLHAIARNAVIDQARAGTRRRTREVSLSADGVPEPSVDAELPEDTALSPELAGALSELPDAQRQAVQLIHIEGLSVAEAAAHAGVSPGALKVRAHRGYVALRARLAGQRP